MFSGISTCSCVVQALILGQICCAFREFLQCERKRTLCALTELLFLHTTLSGGPNQKHRETSVRLVLCRLNSTDETIDMENVRWKWSHTGGLWTHRLGMPSEAAQGVAMTRSEPYWTINLQSK